MGPAERLAPYLFQFQPGLDEVGKPKNSHITQEKRFLMTCKLPACAVGGFVQRG